MKRLSDYYISRFVGGHPIQNRRKSLKQVLSHKPESDAMSKELLQHGFKFVSSAIYYAFMQAVDVVNDHRVDCFEHAMRSRMEQGQVLENEIGSVWNG